MPKQTCGMVYKEGLVSYRTILGLLEDEILRSTIRRKAAIFDTNYLNVHDDHLANRIIGALQGGSVRMNRSKTKIPLRYLLPWLMSVCFMLFIVIIEMTGKETAFKTLTSPRARFFESVPLKHDVPLDLRTNELSLYLDQTYTYLDPKDVANVSNPRFLFSNVSSKPISIGLTSVKTTTVRLISPRKDHIKLGDVLHFIVEARDDRRQPRPTGGDFWLAVLRGETNDGVPASTAGKIVDHNNGSYSIYFVAAWAGKASAHVVLAMTAEAVDWFKYHFATAAISPKWHGVFTLPNREDKAMSTCVISTGSVVFNKCVYRRPSALSYTSLVCDPPKDFPCDALSLLTDGSSSHGQYFKKLLKERNDNFNIPFLQKNFFYRPIRSEDGSINISAKLSANIVTDLDMEIQLCKPDMGNVLSEGFWRNGTWHTLACRSGNMGGTKNPQKCLAGKNVMLSGDSTTRQWYILLNDLLGKPVNTSGAKIFLAEQFYPENNINVSFTFHPLSVHPHRIFVNLSKVLFEEELFHGITQNDCEKTVILISPWAHFVGWPWKAFLDYAQGIRKGVSYAKSVCPNLPIFLKSSHIIEHSASKIGKDWLSRRISLTLKDMLKGLGVYFIDIWDITLSSDFSIRLHMPNDVILAELQVFFEYLHC